MDMEHLEQVRAIQSTTSEYRHRNSPLPNFPPTSTSLPPLQFLSFYRLLVLAISASVSIAGTFRPWQDEKQRARVMTLATGPNCMRRRRRCSRALVDIREGSLMKAVTCGLASAPGEKLTKTGSDSAPYGVLRL